MFCCFRNLRSTSNDNPQDNDYRWKKGNNNNNKKAYSRGGKSGSLNNPSGPTSQVFYIDSGYSTNTDSNVDVVMPPAAKLDPNSQLQRKSKLHNEKLPSFSALDRSKRPRMRREDAVAEEDAASVVYEPLTFETFRSSSPPLAVIAPLANAQAQCHNGSQHSNRYPERARDRKTKAQTKFQEDVDDDSQSIPKLAHPMSISKDGAVTFQRKGLVNEGFCPDVNDPLVLSEDRPSLTAEELSTTSKHRYTETAPRLRPSSLNLQDYDRHSPSSLTSSVSVLPDESSCAESAAFESDTLSQTRKQLGLPSKDEVSQLLVSQPELHTSSLLEVPDAYYTQHQRGVLDENNGWNKNDITDEKPGAANNCDKRTALESIPETPSMGKKIPPKKPKRKNPPSNVSSVASRDAIIKCLAAKEEEDSKVTSREMRRQSDAGLRHCDYDVFQMDDVVLMPPEPFMDHEEEYAGFDSFDEVNGSLV